MGSEGDPLIDRIGLTQVRPETAGSPRDIVLDMSYDLAVWEGARPANNDEALSAYTELMDRAEAMPEPEPPSLAIAAYVQALLDHWPDITDDVGDESPWSDGPLLGNANGALFYFGMIFSMADEASEYAAQVAAERGLVCFDPQQGCLRPPGPADGRQADVSLQPVVCVSCGKLIEANEPRAESVGEDGYRHLACLFASP